MPPIWQGHKLIVCTGTGGVGKTTVSATIAIAAAKQGLETMVMTIDPARRLANALGIEDAGNIETQVDPKFFEPHNFELAAPLWVMMPDVKQTFDSLIYKLSDSKHKRDKILNNRFYQQLSTTLAGAQEYAAVEKLYEIYHSGRYDLIVLDTPPSQNAIDFLEAPGKMLDFLEHESLQWFIKPYAVAGKFSMRMLDFGGNLMHRTLGKMAGGDTLKQLAEFMLAISAMFDGFRERYNGIRDLLLSDEVAFSLVTSPSCNQRTAMLQFYRELRESGYPARTVICNRLRTINYTAGDIPDLVAALPDSLGKAETDLLEKALYDEAALAERDQNAVEEIRENLKEASLILLPELPLDAHDLGSLIKLHEAFIDTERRIC